MYGQGSMTDQTCQKWFEKFCAGEFSLDNVPRSGRPVKVDGDQIETLSENNQHYTMWKIADILKISKSIKLLVKMKNVSFILWKNQNRLFGQPPSSWSRVVRGGFSRWGTCGCVRPVTYAKL